MSTTTIRLLTDQMISTVHRPAGHVRDASAPSRANSRGSAPWRLTLVVLIAIVSITGCARPNGDLGRADQRFYLTHDWLAPLAGTLTQSALRTQLVSRLNYTERDARLRSASWALIMPAHHDDWLNQARVELARTRFLDPLGLKQNPKAYHRALRAQKYASSTARWNRMIDDLESDLALVDPFYEAASKTIAHDRIRIEASGNLVDTPKWNSRNIGGRIRENDVIISWTLNSLDLRYLGYHHAYQRLMAEEPPEDAATGRRVLSAISRLHAAIAATRGDLDGKAQSFDYARPIVTK
ncbi:MAG: hypothetical protein AAGH82_07035 [Pseudomonadota bacterium]